MKDKILIGIIIIFGIVIVILSVLLYKNNELKENDSKITNTYSDEVVVVTNNSTNTYVQNVTNQLNNNIVEITEDDFEEATIDDDYKIEIQEDTISKSGATIIITNLSGNQFGCGVEFYVQEKIDDKWNYLEMEEGSSWISIAYLSDENCQFKQNIDWTNYYGELSSGIYRIVKPILISDETVTLYTEEFEIE